MISRDDVENLARLARVDISEEETDEMVAELDSIVAYVSEVQKVKTEDVKGEERIGLLRNIMRDDVDPYEDKMFTEDILREAPNADDTYIRVKKIIN